MTASIIRVEQLGKRYRVRQRSSGTRYRRLSEDLWNAAIRPFSRLRRVSGDDVRCTDRVRSKASEDFWALRDVSFDVQEGEVIGIIGRNGAGKSTLLKVLSRITEPTEGRVRLRGRVASLLEVGTGFHPELTGRENIYLNGAILGMTRTEIRRKFDEIVAFAEVDRFLDTPVKRYSSGMYVRLAFAVAAHLEPEILVVDEVLAVGDAEFQKKCLGKLESVAGSGRTVLFVSHNMFAVRRICRSAILLQGGHLIQNGDVEDTVQRYLQASTANNACRWQNVNDRFASPWMVPRLIAITDESGRDVEMPARADDDLWFLAEVNVLRLDPALNIGYAIYSEDEQLLYWSYHTDRSETDWPDVRLGRNILRGRIPSRLFNEGSYRIELISGLHFREWILQPGVNAPHVHLVLSGGLSDSPLWTTRRPGLLAPAIEWVEHGSRGCD